MKIAAEISLYPLKEKYIGPIQSFIDKLNSYSELNVSTSATSTIVAGDYLPTMQILAEEMLKVHKEIGQAVFVCKFLNGDKMTSHI
jgi:hypothetical protein